MIQLFCGWTGLINFLACATLALIVLFKNRRGKINLIFALWSFSVAFWSLGYFAWLFTPEHEAALLWSRVLMGGAIVIPTAYLHFALVYLNLDNKHRLLIAISYVFMGVYLILNFTPLFIQSVEPRHWFQWWPVPGPLYHPFQIFFIIAVAYAQFLLFRRSQTAGTEVERKQFRIVAWGTFIGYLGGSTNFFLWYNIPVPPVFNFLVTCYVAFVAYAIVYYKLWDIEFIIRKTIVFTGILGLFLFAFLCSTYILNLFISKYVGIQSDNIAALIAFAIGIVSYRSVEAFLINLTDRYLFQKKYDYQKFLKDATRGISKIESLGHLLNLVVHFITMKMRVKCAAVLTRNKDTAEFCLVYQRGFDKRYLDYRLKDMDPLILYLAREKEGVELEHIKGYIGAGNRKTVKGESPHVYDFHAIKSRMEELRAACLVPSFLGKELRNILVLGEKKSGNFFSTGDINVLFTLAQESAIAIENARLYDEAIKKTQELGEINSQLEYAKNLLVKALRDTEVANKQLQDTQAQLIHEQKMATLGRLAASVGHEVNNPLTILSMNVSRVLLKFRKNSDLKVGEILDTFDKMEQNIGRIKAVVNTLTGLLKKSEKGKFEPLSLKLILEETLPLVQFQTYLDNLTGTEVEFDVPGHLPLVRGDLERLQEVFLNLFINAYHAMEGKRKRRIRVHAEEEPEQAHMVLIHFEDNGCGMTEEVMKKIFNYSFTTKPPGRGSGMGLYMCKYILELHGGDIKVSSKIGQGTTFTLSLPACSDTAATKGEGQQAKSG
ncbi:MAG: ATP-binding protein [Candidatus Omnitrophota bacterium]|nr:ATP-binding protein [Candidatus Omnitrophota bacterium]